MACKCKKKRGSGAHFLSGVTWSGYGNKKPGSGMRWQGSGIYKKKRKKRGSGGPQMFMYKGRLMPTHGAGFHKRRRKKKGSGMSMTGGGFPFSGSGFPFSGGSVMRWVVNKKSNGRRVI